MRRFAAALPVLLVLLAPTAMLWTLWLDPLSAGEDDMGYYFPLRVMVGRALGEGRWPAGNPLEATGGPLMADPQSAVMHPATWLFALPPGNEKLAYALSLFIGFALAGGGAYLYMRRIGLARAAATFGAVAFQYCGFLVGHRVHLAILLAAAMMPWGLWCIEGMRKTGTVPIFQQKNGDRPHFSSPRSSSFSVLPWLAPVIYLALAAGHWPTFIHIAIIWLAYFLFRARPILPSLGVCAVAASIALLAAAPQILATMGLLSQATRQKIGYASAGENSFFPAAAVMAVYPFLMGNRTPNLFRQEWWGPWHQCEMLGYVGLATLVLAGAAVWRLYRSPRPHRGRGAGSEIQNIHEFPEQQAFRALVRVWTWLAVGAGVWMLGYYLPTYRLVHMVPVLGVLRCPARMVLAVDFALATLAAITIHVISAGRVIANGPDSRGSGGGAMENKEGDREAGTPAAPAEIAKTVRQAVIVTLPAAMFGTLALLALAAGVLGWLGFWREGGPLPIGGPGQALEALRPTNPAVWVPLITLAATVAAVLWWLARPRGRSAVLVALLLADLFVLTRHVDAGSPARAAETGPPPAAVWLKENAGPLPYRVWGLSKAYFHRQRELLLPKTCCLYDVASIAAYGPFQSPAHAHLLGFNICGHNRDWADLLRRNRLLSLYNVRYILAEANSEFEDVLRSVRVTASRPAEVGEDRIADDWTLHRAERQDGVWRLRTPFLWSPAEANTRVRLEPNTLYRVSLEARGPEGGAANFLQADVFHKGANYWWYGPESMRLSVPSEQIGTAWRLFRWTFRTEANLPRPLGFRLLTMSERPIEVRSLSLREVSQWESPEDPGGLPPGEPVYARLAELPAERLGDAPVAIYRNLLAREDAGEIIKGEEWNESRVESLKWNRVEELGRLREMRAPVGLHGPSPAWRNVALATTAPAAAFYLLATAVVLLRAVRTFFLAGSRGHG